MTKKIYLDYQATTPVDPSVLKKMMPYFTENFGNPHSNNHEFGRLANNAVEEAREQIANLINGKGPYFIAKYLSETGGKLLHISTDFVFDGNNNEY